MMTPKENALRIIRFDSPERIMKEPPCHYLDYRGCNHEGFAGGGHHMPVGTSWTDIWGTVWHREHEGVMGFPRGFPLADLPGALAAYRWPDPDDGRISGQIRGQAASWDRKETFLCGSHRNTLWEKCYTLLGMENAMCAFYTDAGTIREVLRRIMDFQLGIARHYLDAGVEMVNMSDDLGTQAGLLLSRDIITGFLVAEYRRLFDLYRERKVIVNFHSCGHIVPILDILMDLGVGILNPVQARANDVCAVREITRGRLALQGGVESGLLMDGPVERIREEVGLRISQMDDNGGYFCSPDQNMPWPQEHIRAFDAAVEEQANRSRSQPVSAGV